MGAVFNYVPPSPMTRAERWAKQDQERKSRESNNDVTTAVVVGYSAYKAGEAFGDAISSAFDDTDNSSDD
jgi:hypothetical protein